MTTSTIIDYVAKVIADTQASAHEYVGFNRSGIPTQPIPFFGDVETASVLTVGVNPSAKEFVNRAWPAQQMTATKLADRLCHYFVSAPAPAHPWFDTWSAALAHLDVSYLHGAAHVDLSPRATVAMGSISNWQHFARMVERDARWFFELLALREAPRVILIAGCVTKRWFINDFIARIASTYGYELADKAEKSGEGRVGFLCLRLLGRSGGIPVFFCSVSPSGRKRQILVDRVRENKDAIATWLGNERQPPTERNSLDDEAPSSLRFVHTQPEATG
jgi:hypothetical protein